MTSIESCMAKQAKEFETDSKVKICCVRRNRSEIHHSSFEANEATTPKLDKFLKPLVNTRTFFVRNIE